MLLSVPFLICVSDDLTSEVLLTPQRNAPPGVSQLLATVNPVNRGPTDRFFICKLGNLQSLPQLPFFFFFLIGLSYSRPLFPCPDYPRAPKPETAPFSPSLMKLFTLPDPKPAYLPLPFFPMETTIKLLPTLFPCSLCLLTDPKYFPCMALPGIVRSLLLELSVISSLFNGSCLLLCRPHHM